MGTLATRKDIPPWVKAPEHLKNPKVIQVHTLVLRSLFGPQGPGMAQFERASKTMFELRIQESSDLTEVLIYGPSINQDRAKWMLETMAERCRRRQERGMLMLQEALQTLELDSDWSEASLQSL
ncbi:developmental pluripotency-associated protein 5A-like [Apodemus sylvaticus]|uniref:developmental pluripotency-associated protein 5A-like n=1 Tax=Apodemus sylvaticus TaxID=10129 RepID=UPI002244EBBA|nr:developmental pluripotency-associated protein 5A-like [Apodemus sylvaticus]